ncbi:MAG: hypothetical protein HY674_02355 [Chloroflexi bacterium]|nr:hypothetical protein [Chloroflexota bacterium]
MLLGTRAYREYLASQFGSEPCYTSVYVRMEIRRSFLRNVIAFYATLELPTIHAVADAVSLWSNKYKGSEIKAVLDLVGELLRTHALDLGRSQDKHKALLTLGGFIVRFEAKLRRKFKDVGKDTTHCARAEIALKLKDDDDLNEALKVFAEAFDDVETCRNKCSIDSFFVRRFRKEVDGYVTLANTLPENTGSRGFLNIAKNLREILGDGASACSCKRCEAIGGSVIALDAPREMRVEHIDQSFNHLCPPLRQAHYAHPSEAAMAKSKV